MHLVHMGGYGVETLCLKLCKAYDQECISTRGLLSGLNDMTLHLIFC